jgi:hypothetical protein
VSPTSFAELDAHMQTIPLNRHLMALKTNKLIVPLLLPTYPAVDLRIQSNTAGIDRYLLRDPTIKRRLIDELGLPAACNLTCYFGCMYGLLFEPTDHLRETMRTVLPKEFTVPAANVVGSDDHAQQQQQQQSLADAVVAVHRGERKDLLPVVGLQVRVGGSWASGFLAREPFRTVPAAFPFIFQSVRFMQCAGSSTACWPVFVTSDSERFVNLTLKELKSVYFNPGNSYRHTDTENVHEARPEKWKDRTSAADRRFVYEMTLINHVVLSACGALVFGQSGFADSAFWAARPSSLGALAAAEKEKKRPAGVGFFMDMSNNRLAWQHTLTYADEEEGKPSPALALKNRIVDVSAPHPSGPFLS